MEEIANILKELKSLKRKDSIENNLRVYKEDIMAISKRLGKNKNLAMKLWASGDGDARHLAITLVKPSDFDSNLLDNWVKDLNGWGICDEFCLSIVCFHEEALNKIYQWISSEKLYIRRAAFSTIAYMTCKKCKKDDEFFLQFLPLIEKYAFDNRDHVRKAINWAFRSIGKRSLYLKAETLKLREKMLKYEDKNLNWVVNHRLKEVTNKERYL